jgi:hypothetical protein
MAPKIRFRRKKYPIVIAAKGIRQKIAFFLSSESIPA